MPFRFAEKKNTDGLPDGITEEEFRKLIVAVVDDAVRKLVKETLEEQFCIKQKSGMLVWKHTGKIVDPEPDRPRGKK